ncbi:MCE family protein [Salinifilum aidingensis]
MSRQTVGTTVRRRLLGVAFLMCVVLFVTLTLAFYNRAFESTVDVVMKAQRTANQLLPRADVKVRGMIVGRVERIEPTSGGADVHLSIEPEHAGKVPSNVSGLLLPQTLFGERYVSLQLPEQASTQELHSGQTIQQDRSPASIELERVLSNTMPLLQAVQPDDLAATLNAVDQALNGRGEQIGRTITQLNDYLSGLNPAVPELQQNLRELVGVARTYEQAAPDVVRALDNFSTTARTVVEQKRNLRDMTGQLTTTSQDTTEFLEKNGDTMVRLGERTRPTLDVLAKYSPQFPCFLEEMAQYVPRIRKAFGEGTDEPGLHVKLEVVPHRGKYEPNQDEPEFNDKRGPRCYNLVPMPEPMPEYPPDGPFKDGSKPPAPSKPIQDGVYPPGGAEPFIPPGAQGQDRGQDGGASTAPASTQPSSAGLGTQNSPREAAWVSTLVAPNLGRPSGDVPGWSSLLVGPVLRGTEVSYE